MFLNIVNEKGNTCLNNKKLISFNDICFRDKTIREQQLKIGRYEVFVYDSVYVFFFIYIG